VHSVQTLNPSNAPNSRDTLNLRADKYRNTDMFTKVRRTM